MTIEKYIIAAKSYGKYSELGDSKKTNKSYDEIMSSLADINNLPDNGKQYLSELVDDENDYVVCWAATHLIPMDKKLAKRTLKRLTKGKPGIVRFDAKMVLEEWKAGRLP